MIIKHKLDSVVGERLAQLHDAPTALYYRGTNPNLLLSNTTGTVKSVAIVGSRKMSAYGLAVTEKLSRELANRGITIVSGLALGVDSAAHRACVAAGGKTIAVLPSNPITIYPASHHGLAEQIVASGGSLVSEYSDATPALKYTFIARNRLIAALADAVLITEAALRSGSLHTAEFALDLGKPVLAVPGPITSELSGGTNDLIKNGAITVTSVDDVLLALGVTGAADKKTSPTVQLPASATAEEQKILIALQQGASEGEALLQKSGLHPTIFTQTISLLEISGTIRALGNDRWAIA